MNTNIETILPRNKTADLKQVILDNLYFIQGKSTDLATMNDWYIAVAHTVRNRMMLNWVDRLRRLRDKDLKIVGYLSAEFLMGPHLENALINLDVLNEIKEAVEELGLDFRKLIEQE